MTSSPFRRAASLVLLGGSLGAAQPAALAPGLARQLDRELEALVQAPGRELASLSVLAVRGGRVVYHRQFGARWICPEDPTRSRPADRRTLYRMASISKLVTTLGVMRLVEQGRLDLDEDVASYLGFPFRNPHFPDTPITLRMLLSHTSSLRDDAGYFWDAASRTHLKDVFTPGGSRYGKGEMWDSHAAPGQYFQYANLPWGVVGTLMERVTGLRFDRLMRKLVLDPLDLEGGFNPAGFRPEQLAQVATLYRKRRIVDGKEVWDAAGPWVPQVDDYAGGPPQDRALPDYVPGTNGTLYGPQGSCRMSAEGLGRIMQMLMDGGLSRGRRFLRRSSVAQMMQVQWRSLPGGENGLTTFGSARRIFNAWGLGLQHFLDLSDGASGDRLVEGGGFRAVGHLGDAWGLTSAMAFDPRTRSGLVFLIGGVAFNPESQRGRHSGLYRHEEQILTALHRRALLQTRD